MMIKKLLVGLAAAAAITTSAFAEECYTCCPDCDDRWCDEICTPGFLPPAQPMGEECGFIVGADFLWWTAYENDLDYVQTGSTTTAIDGKLVYAEHRWDPGLRVWGGYRWGCDGWDARVVYTYFQSDNHDTTVDDNKELDAYLLHALTATGSYDPDKATSNIDIDYQTLDLLFSRPYCVSPSLLARPFFGFRALFLERDLKVTYYEASDVRKVDWTSEFDAYGLHGGMNWDLNLCSICDGIGMNFLFAGSIVAGESDEHQQQFNNASKIINVKENQCIASFGYHLGANMSWESNISCAYVILNVGYEFNHWLNLPQVRRYLNDESVPNCQGRSGSATNGNLLVHGLVVRGELHF